MSRKLFCELNFVTYRISLFKGIFIRRLKWIFEWKSFACKYEEAALPIKICEHTSLIRKGVWEI